VKAPEKKRARSKTRIFVMVCLAILLLGAGSYLFINEALSSTKNVFSDSQSFSLADVVQNVAEPDSIQLKGEADGRTNFMIYGLTLDENRTDTMMLASYFWNEHKLVTLNIPRDLYTDYQGYQGKIVSLYAVAKDSQPNNQSYPPEYVSNFISQEYGIPIDYWVVINMKAFTQLVDDLGGVTINVQRSFTDYEYPNSDYTGYIRPAPHFNAGIQTMDGATALIYARSRHSTDPLEGTDFARSRRQEQVIQAVLFKLQDQGILRNASQLNTYLQIFSNNLYTNLSPTEAVKLAGIGNSLNPSQDYLSVNWSYTSGFLCGAKTPGGSDILLYGTLGNCQAETGVNSTSTYRQIAVNEVQNLLQTAEAETSTSTDISSGTVSATTSPIE
jgi:LCP family protein required for cell wall assembly